MNCECGKELGAKNKTGRCRPCGVRHALNANPEDRARRAEQMRAMNKDRAIVERRLATIREKFAAPEYRERASQIAAASWHERAANDPGVMERARAWGSRHGYRGGRAHTPETADKIRAHHLAWCPREYWDLNRKLRDNGYRLPERKAMIAGEVERNSEIGQARRAIARIDTQMREKHARDKAAR